MTTENNETITTENNDNEAASKKVLPKTKKVKKKGVGAYPFRTKKDIVAQIQTDDAFALHCVGVIHDRQTEHERTTKTTKNRNARGFMSSHAVRGCELAEKIRAGEELTDEDVSNARTLAGRYGKQLASHFRAEQIAADPSKADIAKVFSAN